MKSIMASVGTYRSFGSLVNDPKILANVVLDKTKEHIRKYNDKYCLEEPDIERFSEILVADLA